MAQHQLRPGNGLKVGIAKDRANAGSVANSNSSIAIPANYVGEVDGAPNTVDTRLLAIGGIYTQTYIDGLTLNDKMYAIKLNDDATTLGQN